MATGAAVAIKTTIREASETIGVRLPVSLLKEVEKAAKKEGLSRNQLLVAFIRGGMEEYERTGLTKVVSSS